MQLTERTGNPLWEQLAHRIVQMNLYVQVTSGGCKGAFQECIADPWLARGGGFDFVGSVYFDQLNIDLFSQLYEAGLLPSSVMAGRAKTDDLTAAPAPARLDTSSVPTRPHRVIGRGDGHKEAAAPPHQQLKLVLDGASHGLPFEGIGALSAGADAALLFNCAEEERERILDLSFKPQHPAGRGGVYG